MSMCSVLVNIPEFPFRLGDLCPQHSLAAMAAGLHASGHTPVVLDFATAAHVDRFDTPALRRSADRASELRRERLEPMIGRARRDRCREIAQQVAELGPPDLVVYRIVARGGLRIADMVRAILEEHCPDAIHVIAGEFVDSYGALALPGGGGFACVCAGDPEQSLPALAACLKEPGRWREIPGVYTESGSVGANWRSTPLSDYPAPVFDATHYPALIEGGKLRIFPLELTRSTGLRAPARALDPELAVRRLDLLAQRFGARGFVIHAEDAPAGEVAAFAQALIANGTRTRYVLRTSVRSLAPKEMSALRQSGCLAIEVAIPTGSQRLLEDFYRVPFGVSEAETILRAARDAGLFVSVRTQYPAPCEDRHTRAETLRLLRRTRPDAVGVVALEMTQQMPWYSDPAVHGFGLDAGGVGAWIQNGPELPYRYLGSGADELAADRARLEAELQEDGFMGAVSAEEILAARLMYPNLPSVSGIPQIRAAVQNAQGEELLHLVEEFNAALPGASHRGMRPFVPVLEAVGN